jgi:hypothetical protein
MGCVLTGFRHFSCDYLLHEGGVNIYTLSLRFCYNVAKCQRFRHIQAPAVTAYCAIITPFLDVLVMFGSRRINPSWFESAQRIGLFRRRIDAGFFAADYGRALGGGHAL